MGSRQHVAVLGAGFIGLNLLRRLHAGGATVAVLDHNPAPPDLEGQLHWECAELSDRGALTRVLRGADVAIHLISSTVPGDEHVEVSRELSDNIFATLALLEVCEQLCVRRVVFASSSSVYGVQAETPIPESASTDPISSHGIQKLAIEKYLLLHRFHGQLDVRIARLSNPFGPGQRLYGRQGFIALTIGHILKAEPVLLRDDGRPVRDFVYIDDVTEAFVSLATLDGTPPVVNIGHGTGHSLRQVVALVESLLGRQVPTITSSPRRADIPVSVLDVSLAEQTLGFRATTTMREGLRQTLRHYGLITADGPT